MNAAAVLLAPWRSSQTYLRWLVLVILAGTAIASCALVVFTVKHDATRIAPAMSVYAFGLAYACAFWLSSLLILAVDARKLRIPGIAHTAAWSATLYGTLLVGVPCALLAAFGFDVRATIVVLALAACGGLAFVMLPRYLAVSFCLLPSVNVLLRHWVHLPEMANPHWLSWGLGALIVLLAICVLRWRMIVSAQQRSGSWSTPMLMVFHNNGAGGSWGFNSGSTQLIRQKPDWLQARPDLRKTGPRWPANSLCVMLGRWYVPQTLAGHAVQALPWVLALAAYPVLMAFVTADEKHRLDVSTVLHSGGFLAIGWIGIFGAAMLATLPPLALARCWRNAHGELPLLALLPGLGDGAAMRGSLLRAALVKPGCLFALLLAFVLGTALWLGLGGPALACIVLGMFGCFGFGIASMLCDFGGRPLPWWGRALQMIVGFLLLLASVPLAIALSNPRLGATHPEFLLWPLAGWLAFDAVLLWLGLRGWRGLVRRPHPFLPNGA